MAWLTKFKMFNLVSIALHGSIRLTTCCVHGWAPAGYIIKCLLDTLSSAH